MLCVTEGLWQGLHTMAQPRCGLRTVLIILMLATFAFLPATCFYVDEVEEESPEDQVNSEDNSYISLAKRYWGHSSRFPWRRLPNKICFRRQCKRDKECCRRWNLCDKSAKVCTDCWYGSPCKSERHCCERFPYCQRSWTQNKAGRRVLDDGRCVHRL